METIEIEQIANQFAQHPVCFTQEDLLCFAETEEDNHALVTAVKRDPRFVGASSDDALVYFIPKNTLNTWFIKLNIRLAMAHVNRLDKVQLTKLLTFLRPSGRWLDPPLEYIDCAQSLCLIMPAWNTNQYVFPLAHVMSFLAESRVRAAIKAVNELVMLPKSELQYQTILKYVEEGLSGLTPMQKRVVEKREGVFDGTRMTLEQVGLTLGPRPVTRERIRQIEAKGWKRILSPQFRTCHAFITALLADIMLREGSLLTESGSARACVITFLAKCSNVPLSSIPYTNMAALGMRKEDVIKKEQINKLALDDVKLTADYLASNDRILLAQNDIAILAESINTELRRKLTKEQKVYLALRTIGKHAHYSKITEVYNSLFAESPSTEHNVHAVLTREKHGVVWIGIKGTFALREWGYEHPSATLFDTVTAIVGERFAQTGLPVSLTTIVTELGKHRQIVHPNSIVFATSCNPKLECVSADRFIPKPMDERGEDYPEELDRIMQAFEEEIKATKNKQLS